MKIGTVVFAFGRPCSLRSNKIISQIASRRAKEFSASVYTQSDISVESGIRVEYVEEKPGEAPPTLRIARGAVRWALREGIEIIQIVSAKPHIWRCIRDLEYAIKEEGSNIEVRVCKEIGWYSHEWFCFDSEQKRTRSKWAWFLREVILKFMPFFIYKWIGS